MENDETVQRNKQEQGLPSVVYYVGFLWTLIVAWEVVTNHNIEILNVIGVALMMGMIFVVWISRRLRKRNT